MIELLMKSRKLINAQDDTRSDLQRLETLHEDESEEGAGLPIENRDENWSSPALLSTSPLLQKSFAGSESDESIPCHSGGSQVFDDANSKLISMLQSTLPIWTHDGSISIYGTMPPESSFVVDVEFVSCDSPDKLYLRPVNYDALSDELQRLLESHYTALRNKKKRKFEVGYGCAALDVDGQWHRGCVTDIHDDATCTVKCTDSGQYVTANADQIFKLDKKFSTVVMRSLILCCSLLNVYPNVLDEWDEAVTLHIRQSLVEAEAIRVFTSERPASIPSPMPVSLAFKYDSEGGPLKIAGKTVANLNERLVQERFALDDKSRWKAYKYWPQSSLNFTKQIQAKVTWVGTNCEIYFYSLEQSEKSYNEMHARLDSLYDSTTHEEDVNWEIGDLCIARLSQLGFSLVSLVSYFLLVCVLFSPA